jgi:6,7-dimethyl-8-ribityllumazine synthase
MQDDIQVMPPDRPRFDRPVKILVVVAGGEAEVNAALLLGAMARLDAAGAEADQIILPRVGDVPQALGLAERMQDYDGYVVLGAVIGLAGIWAEVARALNALGMGGGLNGNGLILAETAAEALNLAHPDAGNAGGEAAAAVLGLIGLARDWAGKTKGIGFRA